MEVIFKLPDAEGRRLKDSLGDLDQFVREAFFARAYSAGQLSCGKIAELMGFDNRWEAEAILKKHGVWPGLTDEDVQEDIKTLEEFFPAS